MKTARVTPRQLQSLIESELQESMAPTPEEQERINPDPRGPEKKRSKILDELFDDVMDWNTGDRQQVFRTAAMNFAHRLVASKLGLSKPEVAAAMEDSDAEYDLDMAISDAVASYVDEVLKNFVK